MCLHCQGLSAAEGTTHLQNVKNTNPLTHCHISAQQYQWENLKPCKIAFPIVNTLEPFPASVEIIFRFMGNVYYIHLLPSDILYTESMKFTATNYYKSWQTSNILEEKVYWKSNWKSCKWNYMYAKAVWCLMASYRNRLPYSWKYVHVKGAWICWHVQDHPCTHILCTPGFLQ